MLRLKLFNDSVLVEAYVAVAICKGSASSLHPYVFLCLFRALGIGAVLERSSGTAAVEFTIAGKGSTTVIYDFSTIARYSLAK